MSVAAFLTGPGRQPCRVVAMPERRGGSCVGVADCGARRAEGRRAEGRHVMTYPVGTPRRGDCDDGTSVARRRSSAGSAGAACPLASGVGR